MKLIITIDTEEDNWDSYTPAGSTLRNIGRIPAIQEVFDRYGARPTYLVTYPVASDPECAAMLGGILESGRCEIGSHCHPWNTPPFEEETNPKNSMMCNLAEDLQYRKLTSLHEVIKKNFDIEPVSFRTGRWGFNGGTARSLARLGYRVDTSVAAYVDWSVYHGPDYSKFSPRPFRFTPGEVLKEDPAGQMLEVPATVGFLQGDFAAANRVFRLASSPQLRNLRILGVLNRLNLLNKVWLSPEISEAKSMIRLADLMGENGYSVLNMMFHSSSLMRGLTPFVHTAEDERKFLDNIEEFLKYAQYSDIESIKLSDTLSLLTNLKNI